MNYQVLYRKWRPKTFADVVGQNFITQTLANEVESGNISHAYLFTGTRGTGKTTCAKILAKAVNCLNPQKGNPCNECEPCLGIENASVTDVSELDAASNNSVDDIRAMIDETAFLPVNVKYRVYILDEVHMLSKSAANAFLKTLEEPSPHVIFILATTDPHKLLPTIHSRCQRFDFKRILPQDIAARLKYISDQEGYNLDHDAAMLIARIADGGLRDAISLLDQAAVTQKDITAKSVGLIAGVADKSFLFDLADSIKNQDSGRALEIIDKLHSDFSDMAILTAELLEHMRNLMLIKTLKDASNLIIATDEEFRQLEEQAQSFSLNSILDAMLLLENTAYNLSKVHNKRTGFEIAMIRLCSQNQADPSPEPAKKARPPAKKPEPAKRQEPSQDLPPPVDENQVSLTPAEEEQKQEEPPAKEQEQEQEDMPEEESLPETSPAEADGKDSKEPFEKWDEIMGKIFSCDMAMWGALQNVFAYMQDGKLCISAAHINTAKSLFEAEGSSCSLVSVVKEICGSGTEICFVEADKPLEDLESILDKVNSMRADNT